MQSFIPPSLVIKCISSILHFTKKKVHVEVKDLETEAEQEARVKPAEQKTTRA